MFVTNAELHNIIFRLFPERKFTNEQMAFFERAFYDLVTGNETNRVTVYPGRAGIGKSMLIACFIVYCIEHGMGCVIVTDSIERLHRMKRDAALHFDQCDIAELTDLERFFGNYKRFISLVTADNARDELVNQKWKPILLVTSQRYFSADQDTIRDWFRYWADGKERKRTRLIIDERPYFYSKVQIGVGELNVLDTCLKDGISDKYDANDKAWAIEQYASLHSYLEGWINKLEVARSVDTFLYWHERERATLTEDDARFNKILNANKKTITEIEPRALYLFEQISNLLKRGAFFKSAKLKKATSRNQDKKYEKYFFLLDDNKSKFTPDKYVKAFVFDATAHVNHLYKSLSRLFDIVDCAKYSVPLDFLHINVIDINTSKNALLYDVAKAVKLTAIKKFLQKQQIPSDDVLLASYQRLVTKGEFSELGYQHTGYFGNLRGFNNYATLHNFVQIGLNRLPDIEYLLMQFYTQPEFFDYARATYKIEGVDGSIKWFDRLLREEDEDEIFRYSMTREIMWAGVAEDLIQNAYRICIRNFSNQDKAAMWLFYDSKSMAGVTQYLREEFERLGATIHFAEPREELAEAKALARKSAKGPTIFQRFKQWYEVLPVSTIYTSEDILNGTGITAAQLRDARKKKSGRSTPPLQAILEADKLPGMNKYQKKGDISL